MRAHEWKCGLYTRRRAARAALHRMIVLGQRREERRVWDRLGPDLAKRPITPNPEMEKKQGIQVVFFWWTLGTDFTSFGASCRVCDGLCLVHMYTMLKGKSIHIVL